jgi:hypothetical protein
MKIADEKLAKRVLAVLYELAGGRSDVVVKTEQVEQRMRELGMHDWTEEQFIAWKRDMVARTVAARDAAGRG